ncbi:MAG: Transposase [Candidatus Alkanophagales archaeon MCA70_species_2]|nr:Transposase [Candidatus Alkanophaga liquidiphilum]
MEKKLVRTLCFKLIPDNPELLDELMLEIRNVFNQYLEACKKLNTTSRNKLETYPVKSKLIQNTRQMAREKAREAVKSYFELRKQGKDTSFPKPKEKPMPVRMNYKEGYVVKEDFTVRISVYPRVHVYGRLKGSDLDFAYLYNALKGKYDIGTAELLKRDGEFYLHVTISKDFNKSYEPKTFIGIDVNENSVAITALDESGRVLKSAILEFNELKFLRHKFDLIRKKVQSKKLLMLKVLGRIEKNTVRDWCHKVSRIVVEFVKQFQKPIIVLENLNGMRESIDYGKRMNRRLHKIPYAMIQSFIEYKALWDDVLVERVDPRNTSHRCPLCGGRGVRRKRLFKCSCGLQDHADRIASLNIALRGYTYLKENVPPVKRLPALRKVRWVAAGRVNRPTPAVVACLSGGSHRL